MAVKEILQPRHVTVRPDELLMNVAKARGIKGVHICHVDAMPVPQLELTELDSETAYAEVLDGEATVEGICKGAGETRL